MRIPTLIVASLGALAVLSAGCKPKLGKKCSAGEGYCTNEGALFCGEDGKLAATACHGPKGCTQHGRAMDCDSSLSVAGEGCEDNENLACALDKKAVLECTNHVWAASATCKGAKGCTAKGDELFCDHTYADNADACRHEGQYACTADKAAILKCDGTAMHPITTCRGPKGCTFEEHPERQLTEFSCDDSMAAEGDPCDSDDVHACGMDKKSILVCKDKKFASLKACPGPRGCVVDAIAHKLSCDTGSGVFSAAGGTAKLSSAAGGQGVAKGKTAAPASAKPATSSPAVASASSSKPVASAAPSASVKPSTSATASALPSAKTAASATPAASTKPGAAASAKAAPKKK